MAVQYAEWKTNAKSTGDANFMPFHCLTRNAANSLFVTGSMCDDRVTAVIVSGIN